MDNPEDTAGMGVLNPGTSTVPTASNDVAPKSSSSTRYNLLDQLLSSDSDSDTGVAESKPALSSATGVSFAVQNPEHSSSEEDMHSPGGSAEPEKHKSPVKMSAVARLAAARRKRAQELSVGGEGRGGALSSSDSDDTGVSPTSKRPVSSFTSMRISADSDSEPEPTTTGNAEANSNAVEEVAKEKKKRRQPRAKDGNTVRAASKAAMAMIHEESARLIRETAVAINPMDYTRPLELDDFFAKFDTMVAQKTQGTRRTRNIAAALAKSSVRVGASIVQCDSDGDDYDLVIDDCCATPVPNNPMTRKMLAVPKTTQQLKDEVPASKGGELESILKYGSQPIHLTAGRPGELHGMRRTDGSRALRDLNHALLDAMYSSEKDSSKSGKTIGTGAGKAEETDDGMDDDGSEGDQGGSHESEGESSDDDAVMDEAKSPGVVMPRKNRAVVVSDDDDDETSAANQSTLDIEVALAKPVVEAAAASKTKFLSMFKMPAAKAPPPPHPRTTEPERPREPQQLSYPMTSEQEESITGSQDPLHLLSSQIDQLNTQDSLLMTPDPLPNNIDDIMGFGTQLAIDSNAFGSQQSQADAVDSESTQSTQEMQPTQAVQSTQPTQLTAADGGDVLSSLPTLVRKALVHNQGGSAENVDDASKSHTPLPANSSANSPADMPANIDDDVQRLSDASDHEEAAETNSSLPKGTTGGRRFLRRHHHHDGNKKSKLSKTKKQAIRTEFVEAEAEEGESTDSDNEAGGRHGKFNWGGAPSASKPDDDDDDELDMDTDEEEAALLADPMINNDVAEDQKADQAIRDLHRQQDLEQDEQDIQDLVKDINMGRLRNRTNGSRTGFALAEEDYIDRQTRAERMEERLRQRRKLQAREIHDTNLAEIAKNPETAAFAQAALMRPMAAHRHQPGNDTDDDGFLSGNEAYDLEERVDDHVIASAVQSHLSRTLRRVNSDAESDREGGVGGGKGSAGDEASGRRGRIVGPANNSADESQQSAASSSFFDIGDEDGGLFTSVAVEKLIVRRKTLMAAASSGADGSANGARRSGVWPVLKRPGMPLTGASTKRANASNGAAGNKL
ncbi:hypothetical protein GGI23_000667 [Coemansia sp. RSA 2559]|nr:hypothetical protein GGI23_000667 [Coemansia sp. RSA 2559]